MNDALTIAGAALGGAGVSVVMVGGLWWTLRRLPTARRPWALALLSFWARLAFAAAALVLIAAGDWRRAVAALVGFVVGRTLLVRVFGTPTVAATEGA